MSIQQVFIISRAGSMIYDWRAKSENVGFIRPISQGTRVNRNEDICKSDEEKYKRNEVEVEKEFSYPLTVVLEEIDQKACVVFGESGGIKIRYFVTEVNGAPVSGTSFTIDDNKENVLKYVENADNFPMRLKFSPPTMSDNEKIILSSMFHSLFAIAVQLSPAARSSGIEVLETSQFRLSCLQSRTGVKFVLVTSAVAMLPVDTILTKLYELYADFALKNPFYSMDMPIRCSKFDDGIKVLLEKIEKSSGSITI